MTLASPARARFDGFDGLRAIAAILVVLHHASLPSARMSVGHFAHQFTQLDIGVAIFFLISGFLLYRPFADRIMTGASEPSVRKYLLRRAARIFPAYWLALTVIIVVGKLTSNRLLGLAVYPTSQLGYLPYYGLIHIYRNLDEAKGGINQAWTLAVEVTFYLFLPMFAAVVRAATRSKSLRGRFYGQLMALALLACGSIAFRCFVYWGHVKVLNDVGEYWLLANLDLFAMGMALAVFSVGVVHGVGPRRVIARSAKAAEVWWVVAVAAFWIGSNVLEVGILHRPTRWHGLYKQELHGFVACCLLVPAVFEPARRNAVTWVLRQRVLVFLGVVSYGIYLWHQSWIGQATKWQYQPLFHANMLLLVVFGLAASTATAAASWFGFERPITRWVGRRTA